MCVRHNNPNDTVISSSILEEVGHSTLRPLTMVLVFYKDRSIYRGTFRETNITGRVPARIVLGK